MVPVHEELCLSPGGSRRYARGYKCVQYRFFAASSTAVVQFVTATGLGEHPNAFGRRCTFSEHRVTSGVRSACKTFANQYNNMPYYV